MSDAKAVQITLVIVYSETGSASSYARHHAIERAYTHVKEQIEKVVPDNAQCTVISGHAEPMRLS